MRYVRLLTIKASSLWLHKCNVATSVVGCRYWRRALPGDVEHRSDYICAPSAPRLINANIIYDRADVITAVGVHFMFIICSYLIYSMLTVCTRAGNI